MTTEMIIGKPEILTYKHGKEEDMKIKYTAPKVVASSSVHPC